MKIHKDIKQQTDEWFKLRAGKLTGSNASAIGNCGAGLDSYCFSTIAEKYSSGEYEAYTNRHTERGNELEPLARSMYELEMGVTVEEVGFIEYNEFVGFSPDGLVVGQKGGIEIKCHDDAKHLRFLVEGKIDSAYLWQIQMALLITGYEWWDYVAYNPNFSRNLIIQRVFPDPKKHEKLLQGFEIGAQKIQFIEANLNFKK